MGRSLKNTDTMTGATDYLFASFDHGVESEYFATVTEGIDRDRLRLYGVGSGQMTHDHDLEAKESISCLSWGTMVTTVQQDSTKKNKSKKSKAAKTMKTKVVILGTDVGSIWIYSVAKEKMIKKLPGVTDSRLVDVVLSKNGTRIYFLSQTGAIMTWCIEKDQLISEWKTKLNHTHTLAVNHDDTLLAVGGEGQIELWDIGKGKIIKTLKYQDKHSIQQLVFSQYGSALISSNGKKSIDVWNTQSDSKKTNNKPTHSISMNDDDGVRHLDLTSSNNSSTSQELTLLTVSEKGTVSIWKSVPDTAIPKLTTTIKVMASKHDQIPVLWAKLTRSNNKADQAVVIARGSSARPLLETVDVSEDKKEIVLTRQTTGVTHNAEEDESSSDDNDDDKMEVDMMAQHTPEQWMKALQQEDKKATLRYMKTSSVDVEQVDTMVRRLPLGSLRFIVNVLVEDLQARSVEEARSSSLWLKRVVSFYYRHLINDEVVVNQLAKFSQLLSLHATNTVPKVLALRGRVEMIQQQLDMRSKRAQLEEEDALLSLKPMEGSDDSDDSEDSDDDDDSDDGMDEDMDDDEEKDEDMFLEEADEQDDMAESDVDDDSVASM